uniref:KH domain-containing protein n=1 Tax=Mesocestoides corti TaxID=53468 RepID=A0A5K3EEV2_MESCO
MERIYEKPDTTQQSPDGRVILERHKQVKILVPNSTAGMIIGKNGTYIQEIKERSEAYVQISQKSREFSLPERCVIVAGELHQMRTAMDLILAVIASDPQSSSCPNLSYADVRGPVSSVYPTGSPYAFPFITHGGNILRPDASITTNSYLTNLATSAITPIDAAVLMRLVNGDQLTTLQQQNAALNVFIQMGGLVSGAGVAATTNQQQAPPTPPLATAAANSLGSFCSSPTFLATPNMFDSLMPSAAPHTRVASQYMGARAAPPFVGEPAYSSAAAAAATAQLCPFVPLQTTAFTTPSSPSTATPDVPANAALQVAALAAVASANMKNSNSTTAVSTTDALSIFDTGQHGGGDPGETAGPAAAAALWEECKNNGGQQPSYIAASAAAALMGLYATAAAANSNAVAAAPTPGTPMLRSSSTVASGLFCTRELLIPENLVIRIAGPQGRLLADLQAQTNTIIHLSPKNVFVSGIQGRVISISGDQMNVNYAAAVIENTITIDQLNQQAGVLHQPARKPYDESGANYANPTPGKANDVAPENGGGYNAVEKSIEPKIVSRLPRPPSFVKA